MPNIQMSDIQLSDRLELRPGDSIICEVCMTNIGTRGNIELYTGFAYNGTFIGDGYGNGYVQQTIGDVFEGEFLCPYCLISVTQEVIDAKKAGKNVVFLAKAVPGNSISESVTFYEPPEPEFCIQEFRIVDQNGEGLLGTISCPDWDTDLPVPNTGIASLYLQKGVTQTVTAYHKGMTDTWTFTACQADAVTLVIPVIKNYIGDITYIISESIGDDEIKFTVPITNRSDKEKCFYVDLRDRDGVFLEKAPMLLQTLKLAPGASGNIIVNSYGAVNPSWGISDVQGQTVTFELKEIDSVLGMCSPPPLGYEIIETTLKSVEGYVDPTPPCPIPTITGISVE